MRNGPAVREPLKGSRKSPVRSCLARKGGAKAPAGDRPSDDDDGRGSAFGWPVASSRGFGASRMARGSRKSEGASVAAEKEAIAQLVLGAPADAVAFPSVPQDGSAMPKSRGRTRRCVASASPPNCRHAVSSRVATARVGRPAAPGRTRMHEHSRASPARGLTGSHRRGAEAGTCTDYSPGCGARRRISRGSTVATPARGSPWAAVTRTSGGSRGTP
jgi:hypothetical protein